MIEIIVYIFVLSRGQTAKPLPALFGTPLAYYRTERNIFNKHFRKKSGNFSIIFKIIREKITKSI